MSGEVRFERADSASGAVVTVLLDRPAKLNALTPAMVAALAEGFAALRADETARVVVLRGAGRAFCAGADIDALSAMAEADFADIIGGFMTLARAVREAPQIVIAAVHGYAMAGGFELALLADLRLATPEAVFGLPDAALGLSPTSGMTWLLPRIIGLGRALHLTLTGERIDGREAERIGLVTGLAAEAELVPAATALAERLAGYPRAALIETKAVFRAALEGDFTAALAVETRAELACFREPETRAALAAFERRAR